MRKSTWGHARTLPCGVCAAFVLGVVGCSTAAVPPGAAVTTRQVGGEGVTTVERAPAFDHERPIKWTWRAAAIAEAQLAFPELQDATAATVHFRGIGERMQVTGSGGFCRTYGGLYNKGSGWQANDLGEC